MKLNALLIVLAGTAASAVAQMAPVDMAMETRYINLDGTPASGFDDRASALVYQSYRNPFCAGGAFFATFGTNNSPKIWADDFDFNPGPWGSTTNNGLTEFSVPIQNFGPSIRTFVLAVRLYDQAVDYVTPGQLIPAGAAVTGFNVNITQNANTFINWVIVLNPATFIFPDNNGKIVVWLSTDGALANALPNTDPIRFVVGGRDNAAPALPGTSDPFSGFDFDDDNDVEVTADVNTTEVYAQTPATGGCGALRPAFAVKGDVLPTPPNFTQINPVPLNDGTTTVNAPATANGVKWYRFSLGGSGASDLATTFLDIDTEGSTTTDTVMALYDANGNLQGNPDDNDGSGNLSQLTYGISRRAAVGDGRQYDGRDGELAPGDYFIGVAEAPASFSGAFIASSTGTGTDNIRVNIRTNAQGSPAGDAVAPTPNIDLGILTTSTPTGQPVPAMQAGDTIWIKFQTCQPTDADNFVDIDFSRSNPITDPSGWLFDGEGNQLFASNDDGPSTLPQFSFGGSTPRPAYSGVVDDPSFGGETGTLPAGTYYLAIAHELVLTTGTRWHTRSDDQVTNIGLVADVYTSITDGSCGGPGCAWRVDGCYADYDNSDGVDGDDVIAFFGDWDTNNLCADADASEGVDGDDVIVFFAAWDVSGTGFPGC
jgi:hypothetical protein